MTAPRLPGIGADATAQRGPGAAPPDDEPNNLAVRTAGAITRGAARGLDATADAVVGTVGWLADKTGVGQAVGGTAFRDWWNGGSIEQINPLRLSKHIQGLNYRADGALGVVEGLTQFGVGFLGAGKALSGVRLAQRLASGGTKARFALSAVQGAVADGVTMGGKDSPRVSDVLASWDALPSNVRTVFREGLGSDEDDSELTARIKNVTEGFVLGSALEGVIAGYKAVRSAVKGKRATVQMANAQMAADAAARQVDPVAEIAERRTAAAAAEAPTDATPEQFTVTPDPATGEAVVKDGEVEIGRSESLEEAQHLADVHTWMTERKSVTALDVSPEEASELLGAAKLGDISTTGSIMPALARVRFGIEATAKDVEAWADGIIAKYTQNFSEAGAKATDVVETEAETVARTQAKLNAEGATEQGLADEATRSGGTIDMIERARIVQMGLGIALRERTTDLRVAQRALMAHPEDAAIAETAAKTLANWLQLGVAHTAHGTAAGRLLRDRQTVADASIQWGKANSVVGKARAALSTVTQAVQGAKVGGDAAVPKAAKAVKKASDQGTRLLSGEQKRLSIYLGKMERELKRVAGRGASSDVLMKTPATVRTLGLGERQVLETRKILDAMEKAKRRMEAMALAEQQGPALASAIDALTKWTSREGEMPSELVDRLADVLVANQGRADGAVRATLDEAKAQLSAMGRTEVLETLAKMSDARLTDLVNARVGDLAGAEGEAVRELMSVQAAMRKDAETFLQDALGQTKKMTKEDVLILARTMGTEDALDNPEIFEQIVKVMHGTRVARELESLADPSWFDTLMKYRTQAMLMRVGTQLVNIAGNTATMLQLPAEMAVASVGEATRATFGRGSFDVASKLAHESKDTLVGALSGMGDAWKAARKAMDIGGAVLDRAPGRFESLEAGGDWVNPFKGIGAALDFSGRLLVSEDEFFKQMNYRGSIYAEARASAREAGLVSKEDISAHVANFFDKAFFSEGSAASMRGLDYARYATASRGMQTPGRAAVMDMMGKGPMKFVFPFRKVPLNLFFFTAERTPGLARLMYEYKSVLASGDARQIAMAKSREHVGMAMYATAATLALTGNITGRGPLDPDMRRLWESAGNKPYSIRIGDQWISYRRLENISTPLQTAADAIGGTRDLLDPRAIADVRSMPMTSVGDAITEYIGMVADLQMLTANTADDRVDNKLQQAAAGITLSLMQTLSDKALLTSAAQTMEVLTDTDPRKAARYFSSQISTFVPGIAKEALRDDHRREAESILWDGLFRYTSLHGGEPTRNILGQPTFRGPQVLIEEPDGEGDTVQDGSIPILGRFSPFMMQAAQEPDPVLLEMMRLGRNVAMPSDTDAGDTIDLRSRELSVDGTQSVYDRIGQIAENGAGPLRPLREVVQRVMDTDAYTQSNAGTAINPGGMKAQLVRSVVRDYYAAAKAYTMMEPKFAPYRDRYGVAMRENANVLTGGAR